MSQFACRLRRSHSFAGRQPRCPCFASGSSPALTGKLGGASAECFAPLPLGKTAPYSLASSKIVLRTRLSALANWQRCGGTGVEQREVMIALAFLYHRYIEITGGIIMFHFNRHNPTEREIVRLLAYGEGIISREQFLETGNRTMLSRFRTAGLIKQKPDAPKGVFAITDKFRQAYLQQINPAHSFSGSGSLIHAQILQNALKLVPPTAELTSGQTLKTELERYQKTTEYHRKEAEIREHYRQAREQARTEVVQARTPMDRYDALTRYNDMNRFYSMDKLVSAPDLKVALTSSQLDDLLTALHHRHLNDDRLTERQRECTHDAIRTLQQVQANMTESTVEVCFEAITDNYGRTDLQAKENYSITMSAPILYFAG